MTNQDPKTRPIQNDRQISSLFPTRFLKPAQLISWKVTEILVTISRIVEEQVTPKPNQVEWKAVIYFMRKDASEHAQGYLLSAKIDAESLVSATGAQSIGDVPGKQIKIKLAQYRGKAVLRIDPKLITTPIEPASKPENFEAEQREFYNKQPAQPEPTINPMANHIEPGPKPEPKPEPKPDNNKPAQTLPSEPEPPEPDEYADIPF